MKCPSIKELPPPPTARVGWPWTEATKVKNVYTVGKEPPKVSIVIPSLNQASYIEESIRSVLLQAYPDLEFFIIDGGSTDGTVELIKKYEKWLSGWVSEPDEGQSHAINNGLSLCTGDFFNWHNADDVLTQGSLLTTAQALADHAQASYVTGYIKTIDETSRILSVNDGHPSLKGKSGFLHDVQSCFSALKAGCQPGALMRTDLVNELGGIDKGIHYCMDVDLLLRLMTKGPAYHVDYPVVNFRLHNNSKTISMKGSRAIERILIAKKIFDNKQNIPKEIADMKHAAFASAYLCASQYFYSWGDYKSFLFYSYMRFLHSFIHHLKKIPNKILVIYVR